MQRGWFEEKSLTPTDGGKFGEIQGILWGIWHEEDVPQALVNRIKQNL